MSEDYSQWSWYWTETRSIAALQFSYQSAAYAFMQHFDECSICTINGLCPTGTELNKICCELEERKRLSLEIQKIEQ